jgi:signal transduction histidine kinase
MNDQALPSLATTARHDSLPRRLRRAFSRLNFRTKLVVISTSISLVCLLITATTLAAHQAWVLRDLLLNRAQTLAEMVAANSEAALSFEDAAGAEQVLANLRPEASIEEARLLRPVAGRTPEQGSTFARFARRGGVELPIPPLPDGKVLREGQRLHLLHPIRQGEETIGHVYLRVHLIELESLLTRFAWVLLAAMLATIVVAWVLSRRLQGMVTRPVTELLTTTDAVRRSKDYGLRARVLADDELGQLTAAVNAMLEEVQAHDAARAEVETEMRELNEQLEGKVRDRTQDLQASNLDLQEAIDILRRTQGQLVESEKMAALGGLVAGVAHEINTPLGICVTIASHLHDQLQQLRRAYDGGIRRRDLESFLVDSEQAIAIINTNLTRSADLVRSFKRVAVDQGSEERRRVMADDYINEVLTSLSPQLKRSRIAVEFDCAAGIELDTFPGVIAQIITNLAMNAALHAFDEHPEPRITLRCRSEEGQFELVFADNGRGMGEDVRQRIFDPFFTTKRGAGGSGLGLHITYNQVTQQLGGVIRCESTPGVGTTFLIRFPQVSPGAREGEAPPRGG